MGSAPLHFWCRNDLSTRLLALTVSMSWLDENIRSIDLRRIEPPLYRTNITGKKKR